jgi:methyl-accepting chemotaxis protein
MEKHTVKEQKENIGKEAEHIVGYIGSFEVHSAKDEQALADILSMLKNINASIVKIEASHQKRIQLAKELAKALDEMETDSKKFAEKHGKKAPS